MTFSNPAFTIDRVSVAGEQSEFVKMFDPRPVGASPALPDRVAPTNPVPEVMEALGMGGPSVPRTLNLDLLNGLGIPTWDGLKTLDFMTFRDKDFTNDSVFPGPTIRVPRGVVFHCDTNGKGPPPHTIHWHGIEPTPINDGVGHCSMEIGGYTYQWQPNFIGSYFYHCHRNTMQHFEFGLYGNLFIEPPDAFFASVVGADWRTQTLPAGPLTLNSIPVGASEDGRFRIAANMETLPAATQRKFPGFIGGDPTFGVAGANDVGVGDARAFTVPYDVEAMWVLDDRDSNWSDNANGARDTFPEYDTGFDPLVDPLPTPGVNDNFRANDGGFFAFNDFRADYWFVTGQQFPAAQGGTAAVGTNLIVPANLNSGRAGTRIDIQAQVGQTVLVRCLDAAYNSAQVSFPVDIVLIAWDGRALGVPPFGLYNQAIEVPANTPIFLSTARRFDALIAAERPINDFVTITFHDTRGGERLLTGLIPIVITG